MDNLTDEILDIDLGDEPETDDDKSFKSKVSYRDRKLEHKLKRYETALKNLENINRESTQTKVF